MYWTAISKIQPDLDSTGHQSNYMAVTETSYHVAWRIFGFL